MVGDESARAIGIVTRRFQAYLNAALKKTDLSYSECIFLINLYGLDGITQKELSMLLAIDEAPTARAIKALEEKGYVRREEGKKDRRERRIHVASNGLKVKPRIEMILRAWEISLKQGISRQEWKVTSKVLRAIAIQSTKMSFPGEQRWTKP
jgi:DNA-binding MarR family transcriptional regulator